VLFLFPLLTQFLEFSRGAPTAKTGDRLQLALLDKQKYSDKDPGTR
jgi:hypothetical protein